ncbi:hypothetical protein BLOT_003924 [Blomia tropicalis]|nr:hypothetical protein BLOT_003924 [Blomia tropicalis]
MIHKWYDSGVSDVSVENKQNSEKNNLICASQRSKTKLNAKEEAVKQKVMLMSSCQLKNNLIALHNFKED